MKPTITKADTAGWRIETPDKTYYVGEYYEQGTIYKDEAAFDNRKGVCYVPEYGFDNHEQNACELFEFADKARVSREITDNPYITTKGLTYYDIQNAVVNAIDIDFAETNNEQYPELWKEFIEHLTLCTFQNVDWQHPETYLNEVDIDDYWDDFLNRELDDKRLTPQMKKELGYE